MAADKTRSELCLFLRLSLFPPPDRLPDPTPVRPPNRLAHPFAYFTQLFKPCPSLPPAIVPCEQTARMRFGEERGRDAGFVQDVDDIFGRDVASCAGRVGAATQRGNGRIDGRDTELR